MSYPKPDELYRIVLSPECREDLFELKGYITRNGSRRTADRYLQRLRKFYEHLSLAPHRGEQRFSQRPGLRSIGFERRISILFAVSDEERRVDILGFYYAGRTPVPRDQEK